MSSLNHEPLSMPAWPLWQRAALWLAVCVALGGVFTLYLAPDFMLTMANQVWACF